MKKNYTFDEVRKYDGSTGNGDFFVIIDSYVVDLTSFLQKHPAGAQKILKRRDKNVDISSNFLDHFSHTVRTFRQACQEYDRLPEGVEDQKVSFQFKETPGINVSIVGKAIT